MNSNSTARQGPLPPMEKHTPAPTKSSFLLAEHILRDIVKQDLQPGDQLASEREMLEQYKMGRGTVREALRLLEYQGVIELRQGLNGGAFVRVPSSKHFADTIAFLMQIQRTPFKAVVEVRSAIEPMICKLAASRISGEALDELRSTITSMEEIVASRVSSNDVSSEQQFNELNTRFHNVVAWSSDNPLFRYLADSLLDIMDGAVVGMSYGKSDRLGVIAAHKTIFTALEARDPDRASKAMHIHLQEWEQFAKMTFPEALERPIPWNSSGSRY